MDYLSDMHIHSKYSWDSKTELKDIVEYANLLGLDYIAITDHVEFNFQPLNEVLHRIKMRNEEIDKLQPYSKTIILKGVEVSEPHLFKEEMEYLKSIEDLDYILGSIHHIYGMPFKKMCDNKDFYKLYFQSMLSMVKHSDIDTVAHFDYLKKYKQDKYDFEIIKEILSIMIEKGINLEVNTSNNYPDEVIVNMYKELGGKNIVIGSDAHNVSLVYNGIDKINYDLDKCIVKKRKTIKK